MSFDLNLVAELCEEVGLQCVRRTPNEVALHLEPGTTLLFQDAPDDEEGLVGFEGFPWHTHGALTCSDRYGAGVDLSYLDLVAGLADGTVLICEQWLRGVLSDRWLVHKDFVDEFRHLQVGEELRVRPARGRGPASSASAEEA